MSKKRKLALGQLQQCVVCPHQLQLQLPNDNDPETSGTTLPSTPPPTGAPQGSVETEEAVIIRRYQDNQDFVCDVEGFHDLCCHKMLYGNFNLITLLKTKQQYEMYWKIAFAATSCGIFDTTGEGSLYIAARTNLETYLNDKFRLSHGDGVFTIQTHRLTIFVTRFVQVLVKFAAVLSQRINN